MKNVLFIASHRVNRAPNQRFRFEQYISYLEQHGFRCTISPLITTSEEDQLFYSSGNYLRKILLGLKLAVRRIRDIIRGPHFDIIFIAREAFITSSVFFEKLLRKKNTKIIFDFDDAIWLSVISPNNQFFSIMKDGEKTSKIIRMSDRVFAGNQFLADYALQFNSDVVIIPTTIDTEKYNPVAKNQQHKITIGWSGSVSTIEHFEFAIPALTKLKEKYTEQIEIKVIGDEHYRNEKLNIVGLPWQSETEIPDLQTIDIGIMPLPDTEWARGKCGLKGLQYMALEIPTIMSPVGVNIEIIQHGKNGFLASTEEQWVKIISDLIENKTLRISIGSEGRKTVISKYSVASQQANYLKYFQWPDA